MGNFRSIIRSFTCYLVIFFFSTQLFAQSFQYAKPHFLQERDLEPLFLPDGGLNEAEKKVAENLFNEPLRVTLDLLTLISLINKKAENIEEKMGVEKLIQMAVTSKEGEEVKIELPGIGKAEYTRIGERERARIFLRVIHYKTKKVYNFFDAGIFNPEYLDPKNVSESELSIKEREQREYLRQQYQMYQSRQLLFTPAHNDKYHSLENQMAESSKEIQEFTKAAIDNAVNGKPSKNYDQRGGIPERGRDIVNIFYQGGDYIKKEDWNRKTELQGHKRVIHYWRMIYQKPEMPLDYDLALLSTSIQAGLTAVVMLGTSLATDSNYNWYPPLLSVIWAGVVGIYIHTYQNWLILSKNKFTQYFKAILLSLSFNYTFLFLSEATKKMSTGGTFTADGFLDYFGLFALAGLSSLSLLTIEGLKNHYLSITNTIINSWAKNKISEIARMRARANMSREIIHLGNKKYERSSVENQAASATGSILKLIDLLNMGKFQTSAGIDFSWGRIIFISSAFIADFFNMKYAENHDLKEKKLHRENWERNKVTFHFGLGQKLEIPLVGFLLNPAHKFLIQKPLDAAHVVAHEISKAILEANYGIFNIPYKEHEVKPREIQNKDFAVQFGHSGYVALPLIGLISGPIYENLIKIPAQILLEQIIKPNYKMLSELGLIAGKRLIIPAYEASAIVLEESYKAARPPISYLKSFISKPKHDVTAMSCSYIFSMK